VIRFRAEETDNATGELKDLPKYEKKYSRATFVRKASAWLIDPDEDSPAPEYAVHKNQNVNEDIGDVVMKSLENARERFRTAYLSKLDKDDQKGTEVRRGKIDQVRTVEKIIQKGRKRGERVELYKGVMTWTK
jgi:hypothetical protein